MASVAVTAPGRKASGWIALLVLFGLASTVEAFYVSHVFRFPAAVLGVLEDQRRTKRRAGDSTRWTAPAMA